MDGLLRYYRITISWFVVGKAHNHPLSAVGEGHVGIDVAYRRVNGIRHLRSLFNLIGLKQHGDNPHVFKF